MGEAGPAADATAATAEYRLWVTISDLPYSEDGDWQVLLDCLERDHSHLGPVIGWSDGLGVAEITVSMSARAAAEAARIAVDAITAALEASELADHYPSRVEVKVIADEKLADQVTEPATGLGLFEDGM